MANTLYTLRATFKVISTDIEMIPTKTFSQKILADTGQIAVFTQERRKMPKTASKVVPKVYQKPKVALSLDDQLTEHLKQAEHHLIEAVKLFSRPRHPNRVPTYLQRLQRAQETITALYREELVRVRGPLSKKG